MMDALKIAAVNKANEVLKANAAAIIAIFAAWQGKKIQIGTGALCAKLREQLPSMEHQNRPNGFEHLYVSASQSKRSYSIHARVCIDDGHIARYGEASFYLASVNRDGVCDQVYPFDPTAYRSDWTLEQIENLQKQRLDMERDARILADTLIPFLS
jgi:hypothetical protein